MEMLTRRELLPVSLAGLGTNGSSEKRIDELTKLVTALSQRLNDMEHQHALYRRTNPPIGTILAFSGEWPPKKGGGKTWTENDLGWLRCDGRTWLELEKQIPAVELIELKQLWSDLFPMHWEPENPPFVSRNKNTPGDNNAQPFRNHIWDLRGYFLRGCDDSGKSVDAAGARVIGNAQADFTALPRGSHFKTNKQNVNPDYRRMQWKHSWVFVVGQGQSADHFGAPNRPQDWETEKSTGDHTHEIVEGGDPETRPKNVAVQWIVKFK